MAASAFFSIFKKDKPASVSSYPPTPILNNFLKLFEFVMQITLLTVQSLDYCIYPNPKRSPKPCLPGENVFI
jgi:hypothetical protein